MDDESGGKLANWMHDNFFMTTFCNQNNFFTYIFFFLSVARHSRDPPAVTSTLKPIVALWSYIISELYLITINVVPFDIWKVLTFALTLSTSSLRTGAFRAPSGGHSSGSILEIVGADYRYCFRFLLGNSLLIFSFVVVWFCLKIKVRWWCFVDLKVV